MLWSRWALPLLSAVYVLAEPIRIQLIDDKNGLSPQLVVEGDGAIDIQARRGDSLLDVIKDEKRFSRFYDIIQKDKGLKDEFDNGEKMTIFAPTNEAIERWEKRRGGRGSRDSGRDRDRDSGDNWKTEEIVRYHMIPDEELSRKSFYDGQLLHTRLKLRKLDGRQRLRVSYFGDHVLLNMYARVSLDKEHRSDRGVVLAVEDVLMPPEDLFDMMSMLPTKFSTFLTALDLAGLEKNVMDSNGMTLMAPDNAAWKGLGFMNLMHLFSEKGKDDLKKILKYHLGEEVVYSTKMMKEEKLKIRTHLKDEELHISAWKRDEGNRGRSDEGHRPADYMFIVNKGEARIKFTDGLAENGVIQVVNEVLIPPGVKLPYSSCEESQGFTFNSPPQTFMD